MEYIQPVNIFYIFYIGMSYINDTKSVTRIAVENKVIFMWQPSCYTRLQGTENFQSVYQDGISINDFKHIKSVLAPSLDSFQFAYRSNRSTDDAIAIALHPPNAVHRFQFSIQHNHPSIAHSKIGPARAQHVSVQLAVGLPDWETSGSMGRQ